LTVAAAVAAVALAAAAPTPEQIQALYDRGRATDDRAAVRAAERLDHRPLHLRIPATLPRVPDRRAHPPGTPDARLSLALERLGRSFDGWAAFWVHDLRTGRTAGWNSDARFPAASTVKLGVLAAALRAVSVAPERSRFWYDLRQLAGWSSNLAANRLLEQLGTSRVSSALGGLGMIQSTYPGPYRVGTARLDAPKPPPLSTWRYTTARDLGRALYALQAAASGNRYQQRQTGLSRARARLALELLLAGWAGGDNAGLVRPFVHGAPVAQKNGWISDARLTASIVYARSGPKIVVVLAYRPNLPYREAQSLGKRVLTSARIP
jgi:beta-lactamase class A